jgi:hypothetical protein
VLALAGGVIAFGLALLSKEAALALPGVIALRLLLFQPASFRRTFASRVGAYAAVLVGYLALRVHVLGGMGGYRASAHAGSIAFPSTALGDVASFFFPLNADLFKELSTPWAQYAVALAMGAGVLWWARGITGIPSRRLWYTIGFLFIAAVPIWMFGATSPDLESSRFSYLPMIALAWLFGDLCAGRGIGWRKSGAVAALTILMGAGLTAWYVTPWQRARLSVEGALAAGRTSLEQLERQDGRVTMYVQGLPDTYLGAQVFRNCFAQALSMELRRPAPVRDVSRYSDLSPEVLAESTLLPGEYVAAWQQATHSFQIIAAGRPDIGQSGRNGR